MGNEPQAVYWNEVAGPKWVKMDDAIEARYAAINDLLLARVAARPGERILDIGCGTGITTLPLANEVGPDGSITGIDISAPMLDVARLRCARARNIKFQLCDAQTHPFEGQNFDCLVSRFGVMFFDNPFAAFGNLHRALAPHGRLCFICWAGLKENPHWQIPFDIAVARLGRPAEKPPHTPGPLAFSDPDYLLDILSKAGFRHILIEPVVVPIIGESPEEDSRIAGLIGPSGALLDEKQAGDAMRDEFRLAVAEALRPFVKPAGMRVPATVFVVTAKR